MYKKIALSLCFTLFLGLLTACSPEGLLHLKTTESNTAPSAKKSKNAGKNESISAPIALPPAFNNQPTKLGQTKNQYMPNGLPALKPMKGINADTLFTKNIKDTGDRFNRVENAVVDLKKEFDTYKPSIVRLAAVESDIQNLIKELEVLLQETPANQPPQTLVEPSEPQLQVTQLTPQPSPRLDPQKVVQAQAPPPQVNKEPDKPPKKQHNKPKEPPEKRVAPKATPPPTYDGLVAMNLRVGEHADKLRIVLDTNHRSNFSIDLDNDEKLIIIELPDARWIDGNNKTFRNSKLLESYSVEPLNNGKGSMIVLSLKKTTKILREKRLSPDSENTYHRIYFDLSP